MGNFGVTRDKKIKENSENDDFLSIQKYEFFCDSFEDCGSTDEPYSKSNYSRNSSKDFWNKSLSCWRIQEIVNYCKDVKCSKGWKIMDFELFDVESFRGSIWSDFVPVVRVRTEVEDLDLGCVTKAFLDPSTRMEWDPFRENMKYVALEDSLEYYFKFPIQNRYFLEHFWIKQEVNDLMIVSYSINHKKQTAQNFFTTIKIK